MHILPSPVAGDNNTVADLLRQRLGLVIPADRLAACLRRLGYDSSNAASAVLRGEAPDSAVWQALLRELAIGETYFFRDTVRLESAIQTVYTNRIATALEDVPQNFTAWSAGCATGEEAYTLAIMLQTALPPTWKIRVIGTDINAQALANARRGVYGVWSFRSDNALTRAGMIVDSADRWRVPDTTRLLVEFRFLNLADSQAVYPSADLIVCRNVLLYLAPAVRLSVRERLPSAVIPGGMLVIDNVPLINPESILNLANNPEVAETALPDTDPVLGIYEQARALADQGQTSAALECLDSASPLDLACAWLRAQIYMQETSTPSSDVLRAVQRCLYIDPSFVLGYVALGNLYAAQGDKRSARRHWANAVRLTANSAPDEILPLGEGLTAGDLHTVINSHRREK